MRIAHIPPKKKKGAGTIHLESPSIVSTVSECCVKVHNGASADPQLYGYRIQAQLIEALKQIVWK